LKYCRLINVTIARDFNYKHEELRKFILQQEIVRSITIFLRLKSNKNDKNYKSLVEKEEQKKKKKQKFFANKSISKIINFLRLIKQSIDLTFISSI